MAFDNVLLQQIGEQRYEPFIDYCLGFLQKTGIGGRPFLYALGMANDLAEQGLDRDAIFVGGLGTLVHMIGAKGEAVTAKWRGTHDLDVVCRSHSAFAALRGYFKASSISLSISNKASTVLEDQDIEAIVKKVNLPDQEKPCGGDFYLPEKKDARTVPAPASFTETDITEIRRVEVYGIPLQAPGLVSTLGMKLNIFTGREGQSTVPRTQDYIDIYNLLGVAENDFLEGGELLRALNPQQRVTLLQTANKVVEMTRLNRPVTKNILNRAHLCVPPSESYLQDLRRNYRNLTM